MSKAVTIIDVELQDNTSERLPCAIVLDGSTSMAGAPIDELNAGLKVLEAELKGDATASQRVQLLLIRLGDNDSAEVRTDWTDAMTFSAPTIEANGTTPLGAAVRLAMHKLEEQKAKYRANGIPYKRPWLFVLTDGIPTDADWEGAAAACKAAEANNQLSFFGIGVGAADMAVLSRFSARPPMRLQGIRFKELFVWLSRSASSASKAAQGGTTQLASPASWAEVAT
jgi:uncharacterized protein YegL